MVRFELIIIKVFRFTPNVVCIRFISSSQIILDKWVGYAVLLLLLLPVRQVRLCLCLDSISSLLLFLFFLLITLLLHVRPWQHIASTLPKEIYCICPTTLRWKHGFLHFFSLLELRTDYDKDPKHSINRGEQKWERVKSKSEIPPHISLFSLNG